jgi:hypothetical protein
MRLSKSKNMKCFEGFFFCVDYNFISCLFIEVINHYNSLRVMCAIR